MKLNHTYTSSGTKTADLVRAYLEKVARRGAMTNHGRLGRIMGLGPSFGPQWHEPITCLLAELAEDDVKAGRPPLCSVVTRAGRKRRGGGRYAPKGPGKGFYRTMGQVRQKADDREDIELWKRELEALYAYYEPIPNRRA